MLVTPHMAMREELEALADTFGRDRSALIPMLQAIQRKNGYVSDLAMQEAADILGIHPVEVHGVVSFYGFLGTEANGRFVIRMCQTVSCDMAGKDAVARQLENDLGIEFGETTKDGKFTLEWANCLGMCDQGPALLVNDKFYTKVTADQVADILDECRKAFGATALQAEKEWLV
ncbi:MAG: NADH-quinone oxidoreductase subunit NuoE [Gaiellales bacterium]|nr:NADH-quinone oxidoreductase subunit NuoE [Gaiellales bacterium]